MKHHTVLIASLIAANTAYADNISDCKGLTGVKFESSTVISADPIRGGSIILKSSIQNDICRVQGIAKPSESSEIKFEVWLPLQKEKWTERFKLNGTGGFAGAIPYERMSQDIIDGFVTAGSNMGHDGGHSSTWTLNQPEKVKDWGLRSHYHVATAAKFLANAFYAKPVKHAYFEGCSNGGRQGMLMAQRYPELFDGIASGAPSQWYPDLLMWLLWSGKTLTPVYGQPASISKEKLEMVQKTVLQQCDAKDGLTDGMLTNPKACSFDPAVLLCKGNNTSECLLPNEISALQGMYGGSRSSTGEIRYAGAQPGSEKQWNPNFADAGGYGEFIGHYVYSQTSDSFIWRRDLNWDEKYDHIKKFLTPITAAPSPDLTAFKSRGGKLIQFHGWNDPLVPPQGSISYRNALVLFEKTKHLESINYNKFLEELSTERIDKETKDSGHLLDSYYRLFMLPGVGHCRGGDGPDAIGGGFTEPMLPERKHDSHVISALINWVENKNAPDKIIASKYQNAKLVQQRPICAYPKVATYKGVGDPNTATSFDCSAADSSLEKSDEEERAMILNSMRQKNVLAPRN